MKGKMRIALIVAAFAAVPAFWPWLGNPANFIHAKDRIRTSVPAALLFGEPCTVTKDGVVYHDTSPNCLRFDQPRRFKGVWLYEFEGSMFIEGAASVPAKRPSYKEVAWLDYDPAIIDPRPNYDSYDVARSCYPLHAFEIEFIGRRSPDGRGHMGIFGSEIWVDKMLSAKPLQAPNCANY